jgi:mannitol 2-dehydrogenase
MQPLNNHTLPDVPGPVSQPAYNRSRLTEGIVHFGVGGFHRAHQAMYLDRLMNAGKALDWAICGVGVLPSDLHMKKVMDSQDCLYTLTVKDAERH